MNQIRTNAGILLTATAAANKIGVSRATIRNWKQRGFLEVYSLVGGCHLYRERDLDMAAAKARDDLGRGRPRGKSA